MSGRKLDAPLAVQMASLKKTMQNRDRRRNTDRAQEREADDGAPATTQRRKASSHLLPNATGGVRLGSTLLSGLAAGLAEPRVLRCVSCQATFRSIAEEQQHLAGPAHRKALLRQQTEQEHKSRLAKGRDAAHSAVEAAQWSSPAAQVKGPPVAMTSAVPGSLHHQKAGQSNPGRAKDQEAASAKVPRQTHADLVAQIRQADEPLSVEGWVPPSLSCWDPSSDINVPIMSTRVGKMSHSYPHPHHTGTWIAVDGKVAVGCGPIRRLSLRIKAVPKHHGHSPAGFAQRGVARDLCWKGLRRQPLGRLISRALGPAWGPAPAPAPSNTPVKPYAPPTSSPSPYSPVSTILATSGSSSPAASSSQPSSSSSTTPTTAIRSTSTSQTSTPSSNSASATSSSTAARTPSSGTPSSPTPTPTGSVKPSGQPQPTKTPGPQPTQTSTPTGTGSPQPSETPASIQTGTPQPTGQPKPTKTPAPKPGTPSPTETGSPQPSKTPASQPTRTPTSTQTGTPQSTWQPKPTQTPGPKPTWTPSPTEKCSAHCM
ncbi:hypothetical protein WJX79_011063 [Trebouxia sp. C0005]